MNRQALKTADIRSLAKIVGEQHVSRSDLDRTHYSRDAMSRSLIEWRRGKPSHLPQAIVWPESTEEVSRLVRWAARRNVPIIAYGGGSGVCGGTLPLHGGVIVDLKRMNKIESLHPLKRSAVVQSGIISEHLEDQLQAKGFTLGHFPSSILVATLGGCIAARGAGQLSTKYGNIEDMVESLEVVLPNGEVLPLGAKEIPHFPGMAPVPLFTGSEGTLGIVTRARLRLNRKPATVRFRGLSFVRFSEALETMREIMQAGLCPHVLRLYDPIDSLLLQWGYERDQKGGLGRLLEPVTRHLLAPLARLAHPLKEHALNQILAHPRLVDQVVKRVPASSILIMGFGGDERVAAAEEAEALKISRHVLCRDEGQEIGDHWFKHRYSVSFKMPTLFAERNFVDTIEVATTWDRLERLYDVMRSAISRHCLVMAHFSHAYPEGCSIYFTIVGRQPSIKQELKVYDRVWNAAMEACLSVGGTITHHHGVGLLKAKYMPRELGNLMDLFKHVKQTLDPKGIMNPGKMGL